MDMFYNKQGRPEDNRKASFKVLKNKNKTKQIVHLDFYIQQKYPRK